MVVVSGAAGVDMAGVDMAGMAGAVGGAAGVRGGGISISLWLSLLLP